MMRKQFVQKLLYFLLLFVQIGLIIAAFVVNHLSGTKAGVYRYVYTRRLEYIEGFYSPTSIQWQNLIIVGFSIFLLFLLFSAIRKKWGLFYKVQIVLAILLSLFAMIVMNSELFIEMMAYPYITIVFEIALVIQLIIVILLSFKQSKNKNIGNS